MSDRYLTIGDVCNITTGKLDSNHFVDNGKYPFFTCAPTPLRIDTYAFEDDVVLVAGNNASGNFHINRYKGKFNAYQRTYILTEKKGFSLDYIYYTLKIGLKLLKRKSQGSQTKFLTMPILTSIKIKALSLNEQQRIASVLSSLDDKIELNNKINTELEAIAKTLYDYWFVQFDFPDVNSKPFRSSGGKMVYNKKLKREIPEGWEVKELSQIANITMGQSPDGKSYNSNGEGIIFYQGSTDFGIRFPSVRQFTTAPTRFAEKGDILLSVRAPVGTFNIANTNCCIGRGLAAINSKINSICYLYQLIRDLKQVFDRRNVDGTTFGSITKDDLYSLNVIVPKQNILELYQKTIFPTFNKQDAIQQENQRLASLRDWLLPMLMNGQVGFKDDQPQVKASDKQAECFQKIQSLYSIIYANNELGIQQGEMAIAKDLYLVDRIGGINTGYNFAQHNWGSFDPTEKQIINNKQYFVKKNYPNSKAIYYDLKDGGELLSKISMELKAPIKQTIQTLHQKVFSNFQRTAKAEEKELYATVLKCVEDTQSTELSQVREEMGRWKTPKQQFPDKAAKFSEGRTSVALDTIVREGWHKNVMK